MSLFELLNWGIQLFTVTLRYFNIGTLAQANVFVFLYNKPLTSTQSTNIIKHKWKVVNMLYNDLEEAYFNLIETISLRKHVMNVIINTYFI